MLSDSQCNGQFLVHHFLGHALKGYFNRFVLCFIEHLWNLCEFVSSLLHFTDGVKTYLISFAQAFVHYNTICSKLVHVLYVLCLLCVLCVLYVCTVCTMCTMCVRLGSEPNSVLHANMR